MLPEKYKEEVIKYEELIQQKNEITQDYNGIYNRYKNPVLTRNHIPLFWKYDLNAATNPLFLE